MSKNHKNGIKIFFVIIFEKFDFLKTLKYIRQMKDEIKIQLNVNQKLKLLKSKRKCLWLTDGTQKFHLSIKLNFQKKSSIFQKGGAPHISKKGGITFFFPTSCNNFQTISCIVAKITTVLNQVFLKNLL